MKTKKIARNDKKWQKTDGIIIQIQRDKLEKFVQINDKFISSS